MEVRGFGEWVNGTSRGDAECKWGLQGGSLCFTWRDNEEINRWLLSNYSWQISNKCYKYSGIVSAVRRYTLWFVQNWHYLGGIWSEKVKHLAIYSLAFWLVNCYSRCFWYCDVKSTCTLTLPNKRISLETWINCKKLSICKTPRTRQALMFLPHVHNLAH